MISHVLALGSAVISEIKSRSGQTIFRFRATDRGTGKGNDKLSYLSFAIEVWFSGLSYGRYAIRKSPYHSRVLTNLNQRAVPVMAGIFATGTILLPKTTLHAEAPPGDMVSPASHTWAHNDIDDTQLVKKPIYDDIPAIPSSHNHKHKPADHDSATPASSPTPTDRLAVQIGRARLAVYQGSLAAESRIDNLMSSFLHMESSFTNTIASLAPPKESGERLLPGGIYVVVAAMAGSIISRNRNILLRSSVPVLVGIGAGWVVLPVTMRNVGDLVWEYEKKAPVISENHLRIRSASEEGWRQAKVHGAATVRFVDEKVTQARESMEEWVRRGR